MSQLHAARRKELEQMVVAALTRADELKMGDVALHLNQALVKIDGRGVAPKEPRSDSIAG